MKMKLAHLLIASFLIAPVGATAKNNINPGQVWNDTSGKHINAHGCCVVYNDGVYYWFGEDRTGYDSNGISCYTSTDLYNWKRSGLVFKAADARDEKTGKCTLERPKVIYNDKTGKWVMYIHWENGEGYGEARVCVAVSDRIDGDYKFVSTFRPNNHDSRDQTVFKDSDGKAYHFASTDMNTNINVALLADDYLSTATDPVTETKILKGLRYEAPAIVKVGDTYFGIFSGCTGWNPNPGHSATATEILGYWTPGRNFAIDKNASTTYRSQSTYILKVEGKEGAYIYMGDRWNSNDVGGKSEYVWLPLSLRSGTPTVKWYDSWDLSVFDDCDRFQRIAAPKDGAVVRLLDKYSDRWVSTTGNGFFIDDDNDKTNIDFRLEATDHPYQWRLSVDGRYLESVLGALLLSERSASNTQLWRLELEEDGCYRLQSVADGKMLSVSGASQLADTPVFMSSASEDGSQSFGLCFDSRKYDYEKADMYSAQYRAANIAAIEEREEYENSAGIVSATAGAGISVEALDGALAVNSAVACDATVELYEAATGRTVFSTGTRLETGCTEVRLPGIGRGVYLALVKTPVYRFASKIFIR